MGDMSDPVKNCALEVCCGPAAAVDALVKHMEAEGVCWEPGEAHRIARWIVATFDLAEKGTLAPFKKSIARLAKA